VKHGTWPAVAWALLLAVSAGSCTRSASEMAATPLTTAAATGSPDGGSTGSFADPSGPAAVDVTELPGIVLTADLSDPADGWTIMATIPFGEPTEELGYVDDPDVSPHPVLPASFALAADGSFWILDVQKERVAHFSSHGRYLGEMTGLRFEWPLPVPNDVGWVDGRLFVLHQLGTKSSLAELADTGVRSLVPLTDGEDHLNVPFLVSSAEVLLGRVLAYPAEGERPTPEPPGWGPSGVAAFDLPTSSAPSYLAGVPVGPDAWVRSRGEAPAGIEVAFIRGSSIAIQPVRVELRSGPGKHSISALVGPRLVLQLPQAVGLEVQVAPSRLADREAGGGRWFLRLGPDGEPLLWMRLPDSDVVDELQTRRVAADSNGVVYAMVAQEGAMRIFRLD
jgi:hypothetical protein